MPGAMLESYEVTVSSVERKLTQRCVSNRLRVRVRVRVRLKGVSRIASHEYVLYMHHYFISTTPLYAPLLHISTTPLYMH